MAKGEGAEQKSLLVPRHFSRVRLVRLGLLFKRMKVNFPSVLPHFRKSIALWKVFGHHPSIPFVIATCQWRWARRVAGMLYDGGNRNTRTETYPSATTNLTCRRQNYYRTQASAVRGRQLTTWVVARPTYYYCILMNINIQYITLLLLYEYQSLG